MPSIETRREKILIFKIQMKHRASERMAKANGQSLRNKFIFNVNCRVVCISDGPMAVL